MNVLVTYKSKTGFTRKYAEIIAHETDARIMDFNHVTAETMDNFDTVVYGGGLYAGMVNGFQKAKELFDKSTAKHLIVFATGGTPNDADETIETVWKNNLSLEDFISIPHFYMQGGICYEKMSLPDKILMKMVAAIMSKKKDKDSFEAGFEQAVKSSYDISSKEYAQPLIKYLLEGLKMD